MPPKYEIGQEVIIKPAKNGPSSTRDADIEPYAGQTGRIANYHWISPERGQVFYIYTVQIGSSDKEIVVHEDEMEACMA